MGSVERGLLEAELDQGLQRQKGTSRVGRGAREAACKRREAVPGMPGVLIKPE